MDTREFDQIIIGSGMAGVCCAGELVLQGQHPLLVCEAKEVGAMYVVKSLGEGGKNRFYLQYPLWALGWGGGWWFPLARRLNVPIRIHQSAEIAMSLKGSGQVLKLPQPGSASALVGLLKDAFGVPLPDDVMESFERITYEALEIPYEELLDMDRVPFAAWLDERGADEMVKTIFMTFCGFLNDMTVAMATEHYSVLGALATLRLTLMGEGVLPTVYPTPRDGLLIPMGQEIERRGGEVWRNKKVAGLIMDGNQVTGVSFQDGTEAYSSTVAIATGNGRIKTLLDPLPSELVEPMAYSDSIALYDFNACYLLNRRLLEPANAAVGVFDVETLSIYHWVLPLTGLSPWLTEPGMEVIGSHIALEMDDLVAEGGPEGVFKRIADRTEEMFPGFKDAIVDKREYQTSPTGTAWLSPLCRGPKIPHKSETFEGLWFVGDGSDLARGIWSEAPASAGIRGARKMIKAE